jgi:RDD family
MSTILLARTGRRNFRAVVCEPGTGTGYRGPVAEQRRMGDWLTGVFTPGRPSNYPGEELGLPRQGPRSVARMGRRIAALFVDWLLSLLIATAITRHPQFVTVGVFAAEIYLLTAVTGFTVGKRLLGIRVARLDGKPVGFWWALVRTVLLLLLIPPLVNDSDLRGLHDRAANTVVIKV